jgi:hypothetical protein
MIYVAEHAPNEQRGAWTAWIISTAALGFLLAFAVITPARYLIGDTDFMAWGWRVPFLLSSILLAFSLWIRLKLDESPEFKKMKEQGAGSKAPISETFGHWKHLKPVLIALFGIVPGQAVVWYTGQFYTLFFLTRVLKVDASAANQLLVSATVLTAPLYALRVVTAKGTQFTCGDGSGNPVVVRFRTASAERRLLFDPELKLGEVFMDGSLVVERGTIADLLAIAMDHPDATPAWTKPQQWLRYLTRQFRQFNPRGRSRNNVARLCCCSLRRLAAPTSTHTNEHKRTHEPGFRPALGPHTSQRAKSGKHGRILDADRPLIGVQPKVVSGLRALIPIQEKTGQECHAAVLMMSMQQFN